MSQVADNDRTVLPPPPRAAAAEAPFISVLVPVRNEAAFIAGTLGQLLAQDYPRDRFEVLVADGDSDDDTPTIVAALAATHPNLRLLRNPRRLSSAGRNVAARAARGELLVIIDGHCEIANIHYLRAVADAFVRSGADCLGRPQPLDVRGATRLQRAVAYGRASRLGHHPASHIYSDREGFVPPLSVAVAYRREALEQLGGFDESFDACEDCELNHRAARAGLACFFSPKLAVRYHPRDSLGRLFRQMARYGRGRVRLLRKHPETLSLGSLLPAAFVAGVVTGPLLALAWSALWAVYFGVLLAYAAALLLGAAAVAWQRREPGLFPLLPAVFATVHVGAGWGAWVEGLFGRRPSPLTPPRPPLPQGERGGPASGWTGHARQAEPARYEPLHPSTIGRPPPLPSWERGAGGGEGASLPLRETGAGRGEAPLNALTIDVEDYFHVSGFDHLIARDDWPQFASRISLGTDRLLDLLAAHNVRATFFILGWVAERRPDLVRAIRSAGHEVGCHSHEHRLIYTQSPAQFRDDLRRALAALHDALGERVTAYRAPSFSITKESLWALDVLIDEGITLDSSIYPTRHDRYGIPGAPLAPHRITRPTGALWEFPPPVYRLLRYPLPVGGGGYFRLFPYWLTRHALRRINAQGRPFATYLHPWELDPDQPRLRPGLLRGLRHYTNLHRTEPRLERLLADFRFGTLSDALAAYAPESQRRDRPNRRAA